MALPSQTNAALFTFGGSGSEQLSATTAKPDVVGMGGSDTINGSSGGDFLVGDYFVLTLLDAWNAQGSYPVFNASLQGNDVLNGGDGNDFLVSDLGNDTLNGGNGNDMFAVWVANFGADSFQGGAGTDKLYFEDDWAMGITTFTTSKLILDANASVETVSLQGFALHGTAGSDVFNFSGVSNFIYSAPGVAGQAIALLDGNDQFTGSQAADSVNGGNGNDNLSGGSGNDLLSGNDGNDVLDGGGGNDNLSGATGNDNLLGGDGSDSLSGGTGTDILTGGAGVDYFIFNAALDGVADKVTDFSVADDTFRLQNDGAGMFNALAAGALAASAFQIIGTGGNAVDSTDRILYDKAAGNIYYDADGSGSAARILFAHVTPGLALTASDFFVI